MQLVELALSTADVDRMADFYSRLLDVEPITRSEGMAIFEIGATRLFIHQTYTPAEGELPPENHIELGVSDVDQVFHRLTAKGLAVAVPPRDYDWGRSTYFRDPEGNQVEITHLE